MDLHRGVQPQPRIKVMPGGERGDSHQVHGELRPRVSRSWTSRTKSSPWCARREPTFT
jgi:hypothetical protein